MGEGWGVFLDRIGDPVIGAPSGGDYTPGDLSEVILKDATAASVTVAIPTAVGKAGVMYWIKKTDASANTVTVAATIDGDVNFILYFQDEVIAIVSDDANWWIV